MHSQRLSRLGKTFQTNLRGEGSEGARGPGVRSSVDYEVRCSHLHDIEKIGYNTYIVAAAAHRER